MPKRARKNDSRVTSLKPLILVAAFFWMMSPLVASESVIGAAATLGAPKLIGRPSALDKAANPAMSLSGLFLSKHSSNKDKNGLSVQEISAQFSGAIDPHFYGNIALASEGANQIRVREAYAATLFLPKVTIKAGKFLVNFGANQLIHPRAQPLIDKPLLNQYFWGELCEGSIGLEVSWRLPVSWHSDLVGSVTRAQGTTAFFTNESESLSSQGRFENIFLLAEDTVLGLGVSGATGPGTEGTRNYWGGDVTLKIGSAKAKENLAFSWTNEVISRGKGAWGFYSTPLLRVLAPLWVGGRYDYVNRENRKTNSQNLLIAFAPSDFSVLRTQWGWSQDSGGGNQWQGLIQFAMSLGAHSLHSY